MGPVRASLMSKPVAIASLFPVEVEYNRAYRSHDEGGYFTDYTIPASTGECVIITVTDAFQREYQGGSEEVGGGDRYADVKHDGIGIARDVVRHAKDGILGAIGDAGPAIWLCSGEGPSPTEIAYWTKMQIQWARVRIASCDKAFFEQKYDTITDLDRALGEWMKLDARKHKWLRPIEMGNTKLCQFCHETIPAGAPVCSNCTRIVDPIEFKIQENLIKEAMAVLGENEEALKEAGHMSEDVAPAATVSGGRRRNRAA